MDTVLKNLEVIHENQWDLWHTFMLSVCEIMVILLCGLRVAGFIHTNDHIYTYGIFVLFENCFTWPLKISQQKPQKIRFWKNCNYFIL